MLTSGTSESPPSALFMPPRLPKTVRSCASRPTGSVSMRKGVAPTALRGSVSSLLSSSLLREGATCAATGRGGRSVRRTERDSRKVMNLHVACVGRTVISPVFLFPYENAPVGARTLRPRAETDGEMRRVAGYKKPRGSKSKACSLVDMKITRRAYFNFSTFCKMKHVTRPCDAAELKPSCHKYSSRRKPDREGGRESKD